jgi:hypothetical protein
MKIVHRKAGYSIGVDLALQHGGFAAGCKLSAESCAAAAEPRQN